VNVPVENNVSRTHQNAGVVTTDFVNVIY